MRLSHCYAMIRREVQVETRNPRYFLDLALVYPIVICILQTAYALNSWPPSLKTLGGTVIGLGGTFCALAFAKEKRITLGISLMFMCLAGIIGIPLRMASHSTSEVIVASVGTIVCGLSAVGLGIWRSRNPRPAYQARFNKIDFLVILFAVGSALLFYLTPIRLAFLNSLSK
jgi:hypothetical protein